MDIKNLNANTASGRASEQLKAQEKSPERAAQGAANPILPGNGNDDKVTLTNRLNQVRDLEQKAASVDIDNAARIASLRAAIQDGSYQVNPQKIAEKLIQSEALLSTL
jgi:negative regulator of flagellin synthesis FlgM